MSVSRQDLGDIPLDPVTLERAGAALSAELDLHALLRQMLGVLLVSAGAERGCLLRACDGGFVVDACGGITDEIQVPGGVVLEEGGLAAPTILRAVNRTGETFVVDDAERDARLTDDPYVVRMRPRSILCAPVLHRGRHVALVYLEHDRLRAFAEAQRRAVDVILSHAAIALDNAWLHAGLRKVAEERAHAVDELRHTLAELAALKERLEAENVYLQEELKTQYEFVDVVGRSAAMSRVLRQVEQVAGTDATVLLLGETGTGKELVARSVHSRSQRKDRPLVKVNCAALPATLIESELFGHEKGAFTGALARRVGRFELADGGTIFLDEIGDLPLELQAKLLRVLQEGEFERVGSHATQKVDVRVIAATNRDLRKAIADGSFRPDLYYRLRVFPIEVPPLRERRDDIPLLTWYFVSKHQGRLGKTIDKIPKSLMDALVTYGWPGNVRELENLIERALILSPGTTLQMDEHLGEQDAVPHAAAPDSRRLDAAERAHILGVLEDCRWKLKGKGNAAERLGLKPSTLRFRMKKLGIERG